MAYLSVDNGEPEGLAHMPDFTILGIEISQLIAPKSSKFGTFGINLHLRPSCVYPTSNARLEATSRKT